MLRTQLAAAAGDNLLFELARCNDPPLCPQAIGKVEHGGQRFGVVVPEGLAPLRQQPLLLFAAIDIGQSQS
jgi:hypothetical protein